MVKAAMESYVLNSGGQTVVSRQEVMVGTNPGIEARIEGKNQAQDYDSRCQMILTKKYIYYVVYAAPKGQYNQEDSNRLFSSFKITLPP